jgi:hypothetical protein
MAGTFTTVGRPADTLSPPGIFPTANERGDLSLTNTPIHTLMPYTLPSGSLPVLTCSITTASPQPHPSRSRHQTRDLHDALCLPAECKPSTEVTVLPMKSMQKRFTDLISTTSQIFFLYNSLNAKEKHLLIHIQLNDEWCLRVQSILKYIRAKRDEAVQIPLLPRGNESKAPR